MIIEVKLFGVVRLEAGMGTFTADVQSLEELKGLIPGVSRKAANDLVLLVNGKSVKRNYQFQDGDTVVLLSPVGGG